MFANNFLKGDLLCFVHSFVVLYIVSLEHVKDLKVKKNTQTLHSTFPQITLLLNTSSVVPPLIL